jgi:two-component system, NtrC family, sensor kinase
MRCPRCQHENAPGMKFCGECGTPLTANPSSPPAPSYAEVTSVLGESLEQQTATGEIVRVIARSPTDVQPVFDAIVRSAVRLCDGLYCAAFRFDGERLYRIAHHNFSPAAAEALEAMGPLPLDWESVSGKVVLERAVVHVPDIEQVELRGTRERARLIGMRAVLGVPMLREGRPVGTIVVGRRDPVPFMARQIELLETFADQAVIAIENVRLFNETKEALEQQTATGEILRVISRSPADVQPVMDAVADSAARLCGADNVVVYRREGSVLQVMAVRGPRPAVEVVFSRGHPSGRAVLDRQTVHVPDLATAGKEYPEAGPIVARTGSRAILATPLEQGGGGRGHYTSPR